MQDPLLEAQLMTGPVKPPYILTRIQKKCGMGKALYEALQKALYDMGILNLYACIGYIDRA